MKYGLDIFKGKSGKGWCYEITNPAGDVVISGARTGTKKEVVDYLKKPLDRLNECAALSLSRGRVSSQAPDLAPLRVN